MTSKKCNRGVYGLQMKAYLLAGDPDCRVDVRDGDLSSYRGVGSCTLATLGDCEECMTTYVLRAVTVTHSAMKLQFTRKFERGHGQRSGQLSSSSSVTT